MAMRHAAARSGEWAQHFSMLLVILLTYLFHAACCLTTHIKVTFDLILCDFI